MPRSPLLSPDRCARPLILAVTVALSIGCVGARADKGTVTNYGSPPPLQGGIKQENQINPSLRLTPQYQGSASAAPRGGYSPNPMQGQYVPETIRGSVHSNGTLGGGAADTGGPVMYSGDTVRGLSSGNGRIYGVIPPIHSYRRNPASGIMNYIPGSESSYTTSGYTPSSDSMPQHYKTIGRGVTVLAPELTVSHMPRVPGPPMFGGSNPNSALSSLQQNWQTAIQMITPGMGTGATLRSNLPGDNGTGYVTKHGITTAPGFEVTIMPPGLSKETLGGRWSANAATPELAAVPGAMPPIGTQTQHIFTRAEPALEIARANVLPQFQAGKCDTWAQWYRAVAKTIYTHWQTVTVCPGTAKLEVTVKADHDISARVVDFIPAPDIARNVARETEFRETAVRTVDGIGYFEIPAFPSAPSEQATFEIELKRTVDGPAGISIVGIPSK